MCIRITWMWYWKHRFLGPRVSDSVYVGWDPRIYPSGKFPGYIDAIVLRTLFWESQVHRVEPVRDRIRGTPSPSGDHKQSSGACKVQTTSKRLIWSKKQCWSRRPDQPWLLPWTQHTCLSHMLLCLLRLNFGCLFKHLSAPLHLTPDSSYLKSSFG